VFSIIKQRLAQFNIAFIGDDENSFVSRSCRPLTRRAHRTSADFLSGHKKLPTHLGSVATFAFFASVLSYGTSVGGHGEATLRNITSAVGFSIEEIKVSGNVETSDIDILQELGLDESSSLLTLDLTKAHAKLSSLPWIEQVELFKVYPASLNVKLVERDVFAIWQHGEQLSLIEKSGNVIAAYDGIRNTGLPFFVGLGAEMHAGEMLDTLAKWPEFKEQTKSIIRVADRRWDLRLENGITLRLPERNVDGALAHFQALNESQDVLRRDIAEVDLRLSDRVTIRLTPEALERRKIALVDRATMLKKEKNI
jgi:cell division protein FtsQ